MPGVAMNTSPSRRLVSLSEAAEYLGVNVKTVRRSISRGELAGYKLGSHLIRVDLTEVDGLLRTIPTASAS
jgi:excisionase family DNA binding protein